MPYELLHEDVEICGEKLTVYQASNAMDMERSYLISEANKEPANPGTRDQFIHYVRTLLYPSLVACTTGVVPTSEEFLTSVPAEETKKWTSVAKKLNPSWFAFLMEDEEAEAELEKKEV